MTIDHPALSKTRLVTFKSTMFVFGLGIKHYQIPHHLKIMAYYFIED
jgi:hypothetical protein